MNSALYEGWVRHRRYGPRAHEFRYSVFQTYLDLAELDDVFRGRLLWSTRRPALAWFRRADHFGDPRVPLDEAVRDLVEARTGTRPAGSIRLLTNLRHFGYCMNPVSFYYIFKEGAAAAASNGLTTSYSSSRVETIVAEVRNTPWGETHCYVLDERRNEGSESRKRFRFAKEFHVSPFLDMDVRYDWRFGPPGDKLAAHMECFRDGRLELDATTALTRRAIDGRTLASVLARYPFITAKVIAGIYFEAARLKLKGNRVFPHPKDRAGTTERVA